MQFLKCKNMVCGIWLVLSALLDSVFSGSRICESTNDTLRICCNGDSLDPLLLRKEPINTSPEEVKISNCNAPAVSIAAVLSEHNISVPSRLTIGNPESNDFLQPKIFSGLENLLSLTIINLLSNTSISEGTIETLHSLQSLHLTGVGLPRVFNSNITVLRLTDITLDQTINCGKLRVLKLRFVKIHGDSKIPSLLQHCRSLQELALDGIIPDQLHLDLKGISAPTTTYTTGIRILRLNHCEGLANPLLSFAKYFGTNLENVDLSHNKLNFMHPHAFAALNKLTKLKLFNNEFSEIKFQDILRIKSPNIEVDLRRNPLKFIHFEEEDYSQLAKQINGQGMNITLLAGFQLDCDCQHGWLARAVRDFPSFIVTARCRGERIGIKLLPREKLECIKNDSCYPGCSCRIQWIDNATTLQCEGLTSMPNVPNMVEVVAPSNNITRLRFEDLPNSLKFLDLSNNRLSRMDAAAADKLFSVRDRQIKLAGNPIACDCKNQHFIKAIQDHSTQVLDYNKIVSCYNETGILRPLSNITVDLLCAGSSEAYNKSTLPLVLSVVFAVLTILAIFITLYHRFKRSIQEYLFIRGYCLCCVAQAEDSASDADMLYDVFVSFCHKDEEFVVDELLPGLESDPTQPYRACVHYRDWVLGGFIPEQIARSVERSKRTLVVLSRNFVQSMWGLLEFRSAVMCEVRGRRSRLVAVVLDDVAGDPDLDPELRHYVRTNTYVRWGDPLFWQKLRFALPRRAVDASQAAGSASASRGRSCDSNNQSSILANFVELELNRVYPNDYRE